MNLKGNFMYVFATIKFEIISHVQFATFHSFALNPRQIFVS